MTETDAPGARRALAALPAGSIVLAIGATDTGKTTFVLESVREMLAGGSGVAIVDADLGQSEIGPPGTVGLSLLPTDALTVQSLARVPVTALSFVGALSPARVSLEWVTATVEMARLAERANPTPRCILVDTPGYATGPAARALLTSLVALLRPAVVLAFARERELDPLLSVLRHCAPPPVVALVRPGTEVGRKTASVRAARRAARFAAFLKDARPREFSWDEVALLGTTLGQGEPLAPHLTRFIASSLRMECRHAEGLPGGELYAVVEREVPRPVPGIGALEEQFKTARMRFVPQASFDGLLCGLLDARRACMGIGLIAELKFAERRALVLAPARTSGAVAQIVFGSVRLRADGRELEQMRPGIL